MVYKFRYKLLRLCKCGHTRQQHFPRYLGSELASIHTFAVVSNSEKQKRSQLELVRTEFRPKLAEGPSSHTDILGQSGATAEVRLRKPVDISEFDNSHGQPSSFYPRDFHPSSAARIYVRKAVTARRA